MDARLVLSAAGQGLVAVGLRGAAVGPAIAQLLAWEREGLWIPRVIVEVPGFDPRAVAAEMQAQRVAGERIAMAIPAAQIARPGVAQAAAELRAATGAHVAIRGLGTWGSVDFLVDYPADQVGLAREMTAGIDTNPQVQARVREACQAAGQLGWITIATEVATAGERAALAAAGVDHVTGPGVVVPVDPRQLGPALTAMGCVIATQPEPSRRTHIAGPPAAAGAPPPAAAAPPHAAGTPPPPPPPPRRRRPPTPPEDAPRSRNRLADRAQGGSGAQPAGRRTGNRLAERPAAAQGSAAAASHGGRSRPPAKRSRNSGGVLILTLVVAGLIYGGLAFLGLVPHPFVSEVEVTAEEEGDRPIARQGFNLTAWQNNDYNSKHATEALDAASELGANTVAIVVTEYVDDLGGTDIHPIADKTPSERSLRRIGRIAERRGFYVSLKPHIDTPGGEWRGDISPANVSDFFDSYREFILKYADVATDIGADELIIGTELKGVSAQIAANSPGIVEEARTHFDGLIGYGANWDEVAQVPWEAVDFIGISAYYPLQGTDVNALVASWEPYKAEALALAQQYGKPIVFTEAGYENKAGSTETPWGSPDTAEVSDESQIAGLQSLFTAWGDVPQLEGVYLWQLYAGNPADLEPTDWTVIGKESEQTVEDAFTE